MTFDTGVNRSPVGGEIAVHLVHVRQKLLTGHEAPRKAQGGHPELHVRGHHQPGSYDPLAKSSCKKIHGFFRPQLHGSNRPGREHKTLINGMLGDQRARCHWPLGRSWRPENDSLHLGLCQFPTVRQGRKNFAQQGGRGSEGVLRRSASLRTRHSRDRLRLFMICRCLQPYRKEAVVNAGMQDKHRVRLHNQYHIG